MNSLVGSMGAVLRVIGEYYQTRLFHFSRLGVGEESSAADDGERGVCRDRFLVAG